MKSWLRTKLRNLLTEEIRSSPQLVSVDESVIEEENTMRFTVTPARGGIIVQVRHYDRRRDESTHITHIIHDDEHVSERVAEIVSMTMLRA